MKSDQIDIQAKNEKKYIEEHVRKFCPYRFDDPQTHQQDLCYILDDIHCVAIDSSYTYVEKGYCNCKTCNQKFPLKDRDTPKKKKKCAYCLSPFTPTNNRQKYCSNCTKTAKRLADNARHRNYRSVTK